MADRTGGSNGQAKPLLPRYSMHVVGAPIRTDRPACIGSVMRCATRIHWWPGMTVNDQQARAIAFLAAAARPIGARRWDEAGIVANVLKVRDRALSTVVIATMQAAEDRNAVSPGVIPTAGPHWRTPESSPRVEVDRVDPADLCHACEKKQHPTTDHEFITRGAYLARRQLPDPERHTAAALKASAACETTIEGDESHG